jgi:hypothetical protein
MMRSLTRRTAAGALGLLFVLTSCGPDTQNQEKLRNFISASGSVPHTFDYTEAAQDRWFQVSGAIEDDLRYRFTLASPQGRLLDFIIVDDAIAIRMLKPEVFRPFRAQIGHPTTADAFLAGKWVLDPAGAPPLAAPVKSDQQTRPPVDPLEIGAVLFRTLTEQMAASRQIWEYNKDDITYFRSRDPWRAPDKEAGEVRYDLLRPILPLREDQLQTGQLTIGESQFRKTTVFIRTGRVQELCEVVDVAGHEEFVKNREEGNRNKFLVDVEKQVLEGRTPVPVRQRTLYATFGYPESVKVDLPKNVVRANLSTFMGGLRTGFKQGLIAPPGPIPARCLYTGEDGRTSTPTSTPTPVATQTV